MCMCVYVCVFKTLVHNKKMVGTRNEAAQAKKQIPHLGMRMWKISSLGAMFIVHIIEGTYENCEGSNLKPLFNLMRNVLLQGLSNDFLQNKYI